MHLDEERLQRLLDRELSAPEDRAAREHLSSCASCRQSLAEAGREQSEVQDLLGTLDVPIPAVSLEAVAPESIPHGIVWRRWAAGLLVALGLAGAAYAAPGSPLPALVRAALEWAGGSETRKTPTPAPNMPPPSQPDPLPAFDSGIAVAPGEAMVVEFTSNQTEGEARVSLGDVKTLQIRCPAGAATFTSQIDRLVIDNAFSKASFEIRIPAGAPRVEIRVGSRVLLLKEGPDVTLGGVPAGPGPYLLRLAES